LQFSSKKIQNWIALVNLIKLWKMKFLIGKNRRLPDKQKLPGRYKTITGELKRLYKPYIGGFQTSKNSPAGIKPLPGS
jgi:hypothetical protein